jgi:hypothetical protein
MFRNFPNEICVCTHTTVSLQLLAVHTRINNRDPATQIIVTNVINIPLLSHFFDTNTIKNISDDPDLDRDIIIPPFNVRARDTTIALQRNNKYAYSLKVIAKEAKSIEEIDLDPITPISEPPITWFQYDRLPSIWTMICLIVSAANTLAWVILNRKFRAIQFALVSPHIAGLMRANAEAMQLDWAETTPNPDDQSYKDYLNLFSNEIQAIVIISIMLMTIIILYTAIKIVYCMYATYKRYTSHESIISVEIYDNRNTGRVELTRVKAPPATVSIKTTRWPETARVMGNTFVNRLNIDYYDHCFQVGEQNIIRPVALLPISGAQSDKLQNIFLNEYFINFMITFDSTAAYLANPITEPTAPRINLAQAVAEY